jgi:C4-dicarboxylate-specific signal transduction histidine kinase
LIGGLWILFSDKVLQFFISEIQILSQIQTYKGWFYVLITGLLLFVFLKNHLSRLRFTEAELARHKNHLQQLVLEKTNDLDAAIEELRAKNEELNKKNELINQQNSELRDALRELRDTQAQLMQADKMASLGVLTAGIAHEINNPLNYIQGGQTGLENYFQQVKIPNKDVGLFLGSIKTGIERVSSIVAGLNKLSRQNDTYDEECDLHQIIDNCLSIINHQLKDRIRVEKEYFPGKIVLKGNVGQLHQLFINVLVNASQSIDKIGSITVLTFEQRGKVVVEISDTGCGIEKANLSKIMDPFFTTKKPGEGTGLGLSISYNIVKAHKGKIMLTSQLNVGTNVKIELPKWNPEDE